MSQLLELLQYDFFRNAVYAAILSSIACGITGAYIVARRLVFISGGITHSSFGGIGLAYYLGFNPVIGAAVFSLLSAFGIDFLSKRSNMREDSAIGMIWTVGMAIGIIFIALTPGYAPNLMTYLFGSILTVGIMDLYAMIVLTILIIIVFTTMFRTILYIAFDEEFARTRNMPVRTVNILMLSLVSLCIVMNIRVIGVILLISFLTIPQVTANIFTNIFRKLILLSVLFAFIGSMIGLFVSYTLNIPSGPAIISVFVSIFLLSKGSVLVFKSLTIRKQL
jgi:zinc transport system permease protein